jgi:hypothetical protein
MSVCIYIYIYMCVCVCACACVCVCVCVCVGTCRLENTMRVHAFITASILKNELYALTMNDENVSENHKTVQGKKVKLTEAWNQCSIVIGCNICSFCEIGSWGFSWKAA